MAHDTPGPESLLDDKLTSQIRKYVLDGMKYKDVMQILEINPSTWDSWVHKNYKDFRTNLRNWDNERLINIAKVNLDALLQGDDDKIKADLTKFTLSTLAKIDFSTKQDVDVTSNGETIKAINYLTPNGDNPQANS